MTFREKLIKPLAFAASAIFLLLFLLSTRSNEPKLVWSDEFDGASLDKDKWFISVGDGCPQLCGFGNNELQYYSDRSENLRIEDGKLVITALHDSDVYKRQIKNRG